MDPDFPEVVGSVLGLIAESERFTDYRIVGNKTGTTVVLRYKRSEAWRHSPQWQHRSPVNLTRDHLRQNTWIRNSTAVDWSQGNTSGLLGGDRVSFPWNIDAPVFSTQEVKTHVNVDTQTEVWTPSKANNSSQTDSTAQLSSIGTQCEEIERRSIGIRCKLGPTVKSQYTQATATNQGVGPVVLTQDSSTQMDRSVTTTDRSVWVNQSPGAVGRHSQTEKVALVDKKINTVHKNTNNMATQIEFEQLGWGDVMDLCSPMVSSYTVVDQGVPKDDKNMESVPSPQKGEAAGDSSNAQPQWLGLHGLTTLLDTLEVAGSSMDQFSRNIRLKYRNQNIKGIIEVESPDSKIGYWVVLEDISMMVSKDGHKLSTGRYVKLYGHFASVMHDNNENTKYTLMDRQSKPFSRCKQLVMMEMETVLPDVRSKHGNSYEWAGGYVSSDIDYENHGYGSRSSRGYDGYSAYGGGSGGYAGF
jgi:hypothetical protein